MLRKPGFQNQCGSDTVHVGVPTALGALARAAHRSNLILRRYGAEALVAEVYRQIENLPEAFGEAFDMIAQRLLITIFGQWPAQHKISRLPLFNIVANALPVRRAIIVGDSAERPGTLKLVIADGDTDMLRAVVERQATANDMLVRFILRHGQNVPPHLTDQCRSGRQPPDAAREKVF